MADEFGGDGGDSAGGRGLLFTRVDERPSFFLFFLDVPRTLTF